MRRERDKQSVRAVGAICLTLGMILAVLTVLVSFIMIATLRAQADLVRGAIFFFTGLIMGSTMMSCGTQMQRLDLYTSFDSENLRHASSSW
jgi:hypothetical protein